MAMTDTLSGTVKGTIALKLARSDGYGYTGLDSLDRDITTGLTDGTSTSQATGWFSASFTATTGGITVSLASATDPLGAAGDDVPTEAPDGKDLRAILIENTDTTNYVTVGLGTAPLASWLAGTTPTIAIPAGGFLFCSLPKDLVTLTATTADQIKVTANTASCIVRLTYIFG